MAFDTYLTPTKLGRGAIGATISTFYTVPVLTRAFVKNIDICNTTSTPMTVTLYLVESGGSAGAANTLIPGIMLPANGIYQWTGTQILNAGDTIQAIASTTGSTLNASGAEAV